MEPNFDAFAEYIRQTMTPEAVEQVITVLRGDTHAETGWLADQLACVLHAGIDAAK